MFKNNKNLLVIAVIAIVNALGYGIIIPILYSYSRRFGLSDFQSGMLFAVFSIAQFISTPIIGILSDKYGRRPLLIISLLGTVGSFVLMALARNALWLFLARALDGITAGNIPVATAVISDTTKPEDRAKGFGLIGASFGFGFVFGPAISALTVGLGVSIPFWIAASVTSLAVLLTWIILPETNQHMGEIHSKNLFDFKKLAQAIVDANIGLTLLISAIYSLAFGMFIFAYQPMSVEILHLNPTIISLNFTIFGLMGLIGQAFIVPQTVKKWGEKKALTGSLLLVAISFAGSALARNFWVFIAFSILNSLAGAIVNPVISTLLSEEVDAKSQGEIMGVNASYMSLGFIFGPIIGGLLASSWIPLPLVGGGIILAFSSLISLRLLKKPISVHELES